MTIAAKSYRLHSNLKKVKNTHNILGSLAIGLSESAKVTANQCVAEKHQIRQENNIDKFRKWFHCIHTRDFDELFVSKMEFDKLFVSKMEFDELFVSKIEFDELFVSKTGCFASSSISSLCDAHTLNKHKFC